MGREEILLKEYETCQSHNNSLGSQTWVSISIIITVNLLVLAQVVYQIFLTTHPSIGYARLILVFVIGAVMILILCIFWRWQNRIKYQVWLNNERMQKIEEGFGFSMWKNLRVRGLDLLYSDKKKEQKQWYRLPRKIQRMIIRLSQDYPQKDYKDKIYQTRYRLPTTKGFPKFDCIFSTLIGLWGIVIILEASIYWCPFMQGILFN